MLLFYLSLKLDFDTFTGDLTDCLVRDLKSSSIACGFLFFLLKNYSAYCFLCICECTTPVIIFCWWRCMKTESRWLIHIGRLV